MPESNIMIGLSAIAALLLFGSWFAAIVAIVMSIAVDLRLALWVTFAARRPRRKIVERRDDAAQNLDLGLGETRPGKHRVQVVHHLRLLGRRTEIAARIECLLQMTEK